MSIALYGLTCGAFRAPLTFFVGGQDARLVVSPVAAYLIVHERKGAAVFDTGLSRRHLRDQSQRLAPDQTGFLFHAGDEFASRLGVLDLDPADVRWVINSHLHSDHCGGNASFPDARIVVQRVELDFARARLDGRLYNAEDFETGQPFLPVDGEYDVFGDGSFVLFPTFGHTPGHQSARLRLATGTVVLTSDACYLQRNLGELRVSPADVDRDASLSVLRRLRALRESGARIVYGHDPMQWAGLSQGTLLL